MLLVNKGAKDIWMHDIGIVNKECLHLRQSNPCGLLSFSDIPRGCKSSHHRLASSHVLCFEISRYYRGKYWAIDIFDWYEVPISPAIHLKSVSTPRVKQVLLVHRSFRPELTTAEWRLQSWLKSNFPPTDLIHDCGQGAGPASGTGLAHIDDNIP